MKKGANLYLNEPKYVWRPGALPRPAGEVYALTPDSLAAMGVWKGRGGGLFIRGRREDEDAYF